MPTGWRERIKTGSIAVTGISFLIRDSDKTSISSGSKAANNDGVWSNQETQLVVVIREPFWKSSWFLLPAGLLLTGLWLIYRFRIKSIRREESLKAGFHQQIADMEMRALRAQMNPHFILTRSTVYRNIY